MDDKTQEIRYKLAAGVYYRLVGDSVYVRNVLTRYDWLLNSFAADVLDCLKTERTIEDLVLALKRLGRGGKFGDAEFHEMMTTFVEQLVSKGIASRKEVGNFKSPKQGIKDRVREDCAKAHRLWYVCLELTYRCNERCRHCYIDTPKMQCASDEMTTKEWFDVIDALGRLGCGEILVTGGEPTLRTDFIEICDRVVRNGMLLNVFTNALNIPDDLFDKLVALHPNSVSFSLYGGNAKFHDYITQIPGSFDKTLLNILKFKCAGVDIFVKSVEFKDRFDEYLALRKLGERYGFLVTHSTIIAPGNSGHSKLDMMLSDEDMARLYAIEKERRGWKIERSRLQRNFNDPICSAGQLSLSICPNGDVQPCNALPIKLGNVRRDSISDVWQNSPELKKIQNLKFGDFGEHCRGCKYAAVCVACIGALYKENGGIIKPCDYVCRHAKLRYENEFD